MATWMNKKQIASYLGKSTRTIDRWLQSGYLPAPKLLNGRKIWSTVMIDKWINKQPDLKTPDKTAEPAAWMRDLIN